MGGSALTSSPHNLHTPRMPPDVYNHVKAQCYAALSHLFATVVTPVEAPAKPDFGDVDFLVADPIDPVGVQATTATQGQDSPPIWHKMQHNLSAHTLVYKKGNSTSSHFALPWPTDFPAPSDTASFIQVDVRLCESVPQLRWAAFKHAHGDMWNLLGTMIRPLGLTADEDALWLRIPEIESRDRKRARVFLSADPLAVLDFLGLSYAHGEWDRPFATVAEMFEHAASCRFFFVRPSNPAADAEPQDEDGNAKYRRSLKANDRRRMSIRPIFRAWVDDFIPRCRAAGLHLPPPDADLRAVVRDECFVAFPDAREAYATRLHEWSAEQQRAAIKTDAIDGVMIPAVVEALPEYDPVHGNARSVVVSALKKILLEGDASFAGIVPERSIQAEDGSWRVDEAVRFVTERWRDVALVAWEMNRRRCAEKMREKNLKALLAEKENMLARCAELKRKAEVEEDDVLGKVEGEENEVLGKVAVRENGINDVPLLAAATNRMTVGHFCGNAERCGSRRPDPSLGKA